jgi:uncharacterized lipoprotein
MMGFQRAAMALGVMLILSACHSHLLRSVRTKSCRKNDVPYAAATSVPPLRTPAGLDAPDTHATLKIPALNEPEPPPRGPKDPCLDEPPSFATPRPPRPAPGA